MKKYLRIASSLATTTAIAICNDIYRCGQGIYSRSIIQLSTKEIVIKLLGKY